MKIMKNDFFLKNAFIFCVFNWTWKKSKCMCYIRLYCILCTENTPQPLCGYVLVHFRNSTTLRILCFPDSWRVGDESPSIREKYAMNTRDFRIVLRYLLWTRCVPGVSENPYSECFSRHVCVWTWNVFAEHVYVCEKNRCFFFISAFIEIITFQRLALSANKTDLHCNNNDFSIIEQQNRDCKMWISTKSQ